MSDHNKKLRGDFQNASRPTLTIDWDYYGTFLEDLDCSDEEKQELIETLWNIMVAFVDLGFGIHPAQLVANGACEQNPETSSDLTRAVVDFLESEEPDHMEGKASANKPDMERRPK